MQCEWEKWKGEWFRRRKVFLRWVQASTHMISLLNSHLLVFSLWSLATDASPPQESQELEEALGIEKDTPEHEALERGPLCASKPLKRKRP